VSPELRTGHSTQIIGAFLAQNPDYPVTRVRVDPGEAYIAPTENIIHDGSSLGQRFSDVHVTIRGYFGFSLPAAAPARSWAVRLRDYFLRPTIQ
jgi:hypothetical protein